jgi:hypothetical protein
VGLERCQLTLVRIIEELINSRGDSLRWPRDILYPLNLALTSSTRGGRSVGIVRLWAKVTEFVFYIM